MDMLFSSLAVLEDLGDDAKLTVDVPNTVEYLAYVEGRRLLVQHKRSEWLESLNSPLRTRLDQGEGINWTIARC